MVHLNSYHLNLFLEILTNPTTADHIVKMSIYQMNDRFSNKINNQQQIYNASKYALPTYSYSKFFIDGNYFFLKNLIIESNLFNLIYDYNLIMEIYL